MLRELAPSTSLHIDGFGPPIDREQLPTVLTLLLGDNMHFANTPALLPDVVEWLVGTVSLSYLISSLVGHHRECMIVWRAESLRSDLVSSTLSFARTENV